MGSRRKSKPLDRGHVLFDVVYTDGSQSSNRRVSAELLGGLDGDDPARRFIEEQDEVIAERSGRARLPIKAMVRSKT